MTKFLLNKPLSQNFSYFTKNHRFMKFFVRNLKPQLYLNICQETKVPASRKKVHGKVFFIFDKKTIF